MIRFALSMMCLVGLTACSGRALEASNSAPALYFQMFYGSNYDMEPFNTAWNAARANPAVGLAYTFPMISTGMAPETAVRLYAGRPTGLTTGSDVVLRDQWELADSRLDAAGNATFPQLTVSTGNWTSGTQAIPSNLLCGETQFVVRAYRETKEKLPAAEFLASAAFIAVTQPCP